MDNLPSEEYEEKIRKMANEISSIILVYLKERLEDWKAYNAEMDEAERVKLSEKKVE